MTTRDGYESHAQQLDPSDRDVADWVTVLMQLSDEQFSDILERLLRERAMFLELFEKVRASREAKA